MEHNYTISIATLLAVSGLVLILLITLSDNEFPFLKTRRSEVQDPQDDLSVTQWAWTPYT